MKKTVYYASPFFIVPVIFLLCEWLDNTDLIKMNPYVLGIILFLLSGVIGSLSPANRKFDYIIAILMPLSLFCFMFVGGFLDETEIHSRFSIERAARVAFQDVALIMYLIMSTAAFIASLKPIRICKK